MLVHLAAKGDNRKTAHLGFVVPNVANIPIAARSAWPKAQPCAVFRTPDWRHVGQRSPVGQLNASRLRT